MSRILLVLWLQLIIPEVSRGQDYRVWTDTIGRELSAEFLYLEKGLVGLKLENGREAAVGVNALSKNDHEYISQKLTVTQIPVSEKMPDKAGLFKAHLEVKGGPAIYETRWFQFSCEEPSSVDFVNDAAQIFEATRNAINALPLNFTSKPPQGLEKFKARFVTRQRFNKFISNTPELKFREKIAGIYDPKSRSVLVPYDQLGVVKVEGRITVNKASDSSTLIHEITHQVMHDRLPLTPIWISEGLAEYMAAIPYSDGVFYFSKAKQGFLKRLKERYGSLNVTIPQPQTLLEKQHNDWRGHNNDYVSSLIYVFYFMHLDQPDAQGSPLAGYLHLAGVAKDDTHSLIIDYNREVNRYNTNVINYNAAVAKYKEDVKLYKLEVRQYNAEIEKNQQVNGSAQNLLKIGPKPIPPQIPIEPEMSPILQTNQFDSPIDLFRIAHKRALPSLLRDRDYQAIERSLVTQFASLGVTIEFAQ